MKPRVPITDPAFKYVDSANTCLAKTFARVRAEQRKRDAARANVTPLRQTDANDDLNLKATGGSR
jgi:hypothetical protein